MPRAITREQPYPATIPEAWSRAVAFLSERTLLWSNARTHAARTDPVTQMLHREINYQWAAGHHAAGIRAIRGWCQAFMIAGREYQP